jgi:hypothetical protein
VYYDLDRAPRIRRAAEEMIKYLADGKWHSTKKVESYLLDATDLAPRTIVNLIEGMSSRRSQAKIQRRGSHRGTDDRAVRAVVRP